MFISTVCRLIKPRLYTTRRSVTSISVVQRLNQADASANARDEAQSAGDERQIGRAGVEAARRQRGRGEDHINSAGM